MKTLNIIVSNTGPLISLEKLSDGYQFIHQLYDKIIIPPVVLNEVAQGHFDECDAYLHHYGITELIEIRHLSNFPVLPEMALLHEGEIQAIQLAMELKTALLIEETAGRRVASSLGIPISGIAGQIIKAFRHNIISAIEMRDKLNQLLQAGRINKKIYDALVVVQ